MHCLVRNECPSALSGPSSTIFLGLMNSLMSSYCTLDQTKKYKTETKLRNDIKFDYIVVGSGHGGSIVARRLAEDPSKNILLIEAGGLTTPTTEIPGILFQYEGNPDYDWLYKIESEGSCKSYKDEKCPAAMGKILGGSSSINHMIYCPADARDYDEWEALGNDGWNYKNMTYYLDKALERINLTTYIDKSTIRDVVIEAAKEAKQVVSTTPARMGYFEAPLTVGNGRRSGAARAYLRDSPSNLHILTNAYVDKILINKNQKVQGVKVTLKNKNSIKIKAKLEVVVSAGFINTPHLLMKSGIGPSDELKAAGIKTVFADLPVGKHLKEHLVVQCLFVELSDDILDPSTPQDEVNKAYEYFSKFEGPLSNIGISNTIGSINTVNSSSFGPDVQLYHIFFPKGATDGLTAMSHAIGINEESTKLIIEANKKSTLLNILPTILKPKSSGEVLIRKGEKTPTVHGNYFSESEDMTTFMKAFDYLHDFINTSVMKKYNAKFLNWLPACSDQSKRDGIDWECFTRHLATNELNSGGSVKMGRKEDGGVLDSHLRVYGIENLRVVDASIMPTIPAGTVAPTVLAIAEMGADIIKADNANKK